MDHCERDKAIREFLGDTGRLLDHEGMIESAILKLIGMVKPEPTKEPEKEEKPKHKHK